MASVVLALAGAFLYGQTNGLAGMAIGLAAALFGVFVLWKLIQILGGAVAEGASPKRATILIVFGVFMKLPVYLVAWKIVERLGHLATNCFLAAVILVYFGLVAWAFARS